MLSSQHQNVEEHKSLLNIPSVRRAVKVMSNRGDYRLLATLPEDMVELYFDEEENFVFRDYLLAECNQTATKNSNNTMKSEELDIFSKAHFVLDKYNGSQNTEEWINIFEKVSHGSVEHNHLWANGYDDFNAYKSSVNSSAHILMAILLSLWQAAPTLITPCRGVGAEIAKQCMANAPSSVKPT
ncbi:hypothetical protein WA026_002838 [Henosepilachna vigintioctopunctata]|uniref:Uncharacterized protein n=1 Tax=Henosepilachna vigintioctopunctata TaxID=420089 RepID=A0AAW1TUM0_9CUCU